MLQHHLGQRDSVDVRQAVQVDALCCAANAGDGMGTCGLRPSLATAHAELLSAAVLWAVLCTGWQPAIGPALPQACMRQGVEERARMSWLNTTYSLCVMPWPSEGPTWATPGCEGAPVSTIELLVVGVPLSCAAQQRQELGSGRAEELQARTVHELIPRQHDSSLGGCTWL